MPDTEHPIDVYLTHLARRLHLPPAEREQVLAEVRGHLEERAGALHETGLAGEQAEHEAVLAFGPVGRISRELRATHPIAWETGRWIVGLLMGAVVPWIVYLVGTVPVMLYYFSVQHVSPTLWPPLLPWAWAQGAMLYYVELVLGHTLALRWLIFLYLVLYPVVPFWWGRRAQRWWVPGLAYALGTELLVVLRLSLLWELSPQVRILIQQNMNLLLPYAGLMAVSLPLALAASFLGWLWRERSAAALARAQAA
jgi:hypothetical protein